MNKLVNMMSRVQAVQKIIAELDSVAMGAASSMFFIVKGGDQVQSVISGAKDMAKFAELIEQYAEYKRESIASDVDTLTAIDGLIAATDEPADDLAPAAAPMPAASPAPAPMQQAPWVK